MSFILVCSIAIRVIAFGWSVLLLFRFRDWRIALLTGMIFLMALRQTLTLVKAPQIWPLSFSANIDELPGLVVSVLAFLALLFLERMIRETSRRSAELESVNQKLMTEIAERKRAEEALRESEEKFQTVVNFSPTKIHIKDLEGRYLLVNKEAEELFGVSDEDARGKTSADLFPQERAEAFVAHDRAVIKAGRAIETEEEWVRDDGVHTYLTVKFPIRDASGKAIAVGAIGTDITERKQAAIARQESENRLQSIVNSIPMAIALKDRNGRFLLVNQNYADWMKSKPSDFVGKTVRDLFPQEQANQIEVLDRRVMDTREISESEGTWTYQDGQPCTILTYKCPIFSADGEVTAVSTINLDITERKQTEEALRESEKSLAKAQRIARLGNWDLNLITGELFWSDEIFRMFAIEQDTFDGTTVSFYRRVHPNDRQHVRQITDAAINDRQPYKFDHRIVLPDGKEKIVRELGEVEYDESGKPIFIRGTVQDITSEIEARELVKSAQNQLAVAIDSLSEIFVLYDNQDRLVICNEAFRTLNEKILETTRAGVPWITHMRAAVQAGEFPEAVGREREWLDWRIEQHRNPGDPVEIERAGGCHLLVKEQRLPDGATITVTLDITERKQAEKALRESEERFSFAVSGTADGLWDWNIQTFEYYLSPRWKEILGYEDHEIENRPEVFTRAIHPEEHDRVMEAVRAHLEERAPYDLEFQLRHKDGSYIWIHAKGQAVWDELGTPLRMAGSISDITHHKATEEQLLHSQRLEVVGQLTGGVAHDFNNLMAIIIGNAELLKGLVGGNEDAKECIEDIEAAVDLGASLTNRLLAFSRKSTLAPVAADVSELIGSLHDMLRRTLGETVELKIEGPPDLWPATIDTHQFENALVNLAINARDAMPRGGTLTIETANVTLDKTYAEQDEEVTPGDYVRVVVSDNGTGMSPEVLKKVFEPFFTTKDVGKGSGLGLSMVYGFVKQSMGHITIHSEVDRGTSVKLYMPRSRDGVAETIAKDDAAEFSRGSERILVVEDDSDVRKAPAAILRDRGYEVAEAGNGAEAIDHLKVGQPFDLLFTDVVLPGGMNGIEIAEAAKRLQPDIKVLYTTGYAKDAVVHHGKLDPGETLVKKPYRRAELLEKVRARLDSEDA